ncbi:MAG: amidohydrolase [Lachnospiraceae bacterium]|nr:amidohydrolase [Lachnospiraceae bacterium]
MKTLYYNGLVYTGTLPLVSAFITENGRFVFAGSDPEGFSFGCEKTVDLKDRFVCAGFNDSHMHLLNYGLSLASADLATHGKSLAELLEYLSVYAAGLPESPDPWIRGRGWNQDLFSDSKRMPDRQDLDRVSSNRPVVITRCCGHCLAVNSRALTLCGITADTPAPAGGRIGRRSDGEPDGLFYDEAMSLITSRLPVPDKERIKKLLRLACRALNRYGITSVQSDDYCVFPSVSWQTVNEAYRELEESGELSVRVCEQSNFSDLPALRAFTEAGCLTGSGSSRFRIGPLKLLSDGSLGARTAFLREPYADDPSSRGLAIFSQEQLDELIGFAHAQGLAIAVHAIGDAALDMVLNALEKAEKAYPRPDCRHGIVHCQITRPDQLERLKQLKLHIYAQTIFLDYDIHIVKARVGASRASSSYRWKTLMRDGLCVSNGSDCPVEYPDVLAGIQCAVTRSSLRGDAGPYLAEEAFSVQEALDSYTVCGARASFEEAVKGRIAPGYLADFTVLEKNPFETDPRRLKDIPVLATFLNGEAVYLRDSLH